MSLSGDALRVYVASKSELGPMWRMFREEWRIAHPSVEVMSSWIDMSGPGAGLDWPSFIREAASCDLLLALHRPGDEWKGAFVEIGAALANGAKVVVLGDPPGSWKEHPQVLQITTRGYDPGMFLTDWFAARRPGS